MPEIRTAISHFVNARPPPSRPTTANRQQNAAQKATAVPSLVPVNPVLVPATGPVLVLSSESHSPLETPSGPGWHSTRHGNLLKPAQPQQHYLCTLSYGGNASTQLVSLSVPNKYPKRVWPVRVGHLSTGLASVRTSIY